MPIAQQYARRRSAKVLVKVKNGKTSGGTVIFDFAAVFAGAKTQEPFPKEEETEGPLS